MKSNEIKKAIKNIQLDEYRKIRISNNIKIKTQKENGGFIMNKKLIGSVLAGALAIYGVIFVSNSGNNSIPDMGTQGISQQVYEHLAIVGTITDILPAEGVIDNGIIINVSGEEKADTTYSNITVAVHASTNIFDGTNDTLLDISDLKKDQKVSIYYDGTEIEAGKISALKIVIEN